MPEHDDLFRDWQMKAQFWKGFIYGIFWTVVIAWFLVGVLD